VPNILKRTFRQAKPQLEALEFKIGKKTYTDNIGKDVVIGMKHNNKTLKPGTSLPLTSTIDLILGNGKRN
jgi:beta-lactam-binding protein with PASTA domain